MTERVLTVLGIGLVVLLLSSGANGAEVVPYSESETVKFSGSGTTTTRPFSMTGEWELKWKSKGFMAVHLYNLESRLRERLMFVYTAEGGKGTSYHPDSGKYFLNIVASEPWNISILELKPEKK